MSKTHGSQTLTMVKMFPRSGNAQRLLRKLSDMLELKDGDQSPEVDRK